MSRRSACDAPLSALLAGPESSCAPNSLLYCLDVNVHRVAHVAAVASSHGDCHRDGTLCTVVKDRAVPFFQSRFGKGKSSEAVLTVGVGPGNVNGQIETACTKDVIEACFERGEVGLIPCPVFESYVEIALLLVKREVLLSP